MTLSERTAAFKSFLLYQVMLKMAVLHKKAMLTTYHIIHQN